MKSGALKRCRINVEQGRCYFRDGQLNSRWQSGLAELSMHQIEGYANEEDAHVRLSISIYFPYVFLLYFSSSSSFSFFFFDFSLSLFDIEDRTTPFFNYESYNGEEMVLEQIDFARNKY